MRLLTIAFLLLFLGIFQSCKTGSDNDNAATLLCDTTSTAMHDTILFNHTAATAPYVKVSLTDKTPDTLYWGTKAAEKKMDWKEYFDDKIYINRDYIKTYFSNAQTAFVKFNDCVTGRGYLIKLPLAAGNISILKSCLNNYNKKFVVDDSLLAYTDKGNLFIENWASGKKATMTFGEELDIDFYAINQTIDSINVTPTSAWAKVKKKNNKWEIVSKDNLVFE